MPRPLAQRAGVLPLPRPHWRLAPGARAALLAVAAAALLAVLLGAGPAAGAPSGRTPTERAPTERTPTERAPTERAPTEPTTSGAWTWPLADRPPLGRTFRPGVTRYAAGHRGVDLVGAPGAPVLAAGAGRVAYAGPLAGRGVVVVVHGALRTTYEPVRAGVRVGQRVARGQRLGLLEPGHRDCPGEACLHWGLRRGRDHLDPLRLVGGGRVRLLPVGPPVRRSGGASAVPAAPAPLRPDAPGAAEPGASAVVAPSGGPGSGAAVPVLLVSSAALVAAAARHR